MKEIYNKAYSSREIRLWWENAPGKNVIINALKYFLKRREKSNGGSIKDSPCLLDMGCGTGFFLNKVYKIFHIQRLIGIDLSEEAIRRGKQVYPHLLDLRCEDGTNTSLGNSIIDYLVGYGCYEHFTDPQAGIREAARVLKENSIFLLMIPTLGIDRNDRTDEGWYEERAVENQPIQQMQWNLKRSTWESYILNVGLKLFDFDLPKNFGAIKPGVFYFGFKSH